MENYTYEEQPDDKEKDPDRAEIMAVIGDLSFNILQKRAEAVEFRAASGIERMWQEDDVAFDGADSYYHGSYGSYHRQNMIDYASGEAGVRHNKGPKRSQVVVNIIRGKCETAEGRFSDILFPVDDKNWELKETPVPDISIALKDDRPASIDGEQINKEGRPVQEGEDPITMSDVARMDMDKIKDKMKLMSTEIDDQLTEAKYNSKCRKSVQDSVRTGTGIMKGPNIVKRVRKAWIPTPGGEEKGLHELEVHEEHRPTSEVVSCWNVFPDPDCGEDIKKAAYVFEFDNIRPNELRDLHGVPGYIDSEIIKVLKEEPKRTTVGLDEESKKHKMRYTTASMGNLYEKWTYYGDLDREDLETLNVDLDHDDIAQSFSACIVFVNDRPIKVCLNPLDTGDMPYDFFQWTSVRDSPWGIGLPRMMMWLQRILTAAWRAMMDNAGDSSGVNVVIGPGIEPVDQVMELTGKKIWRWSGDGDEGEFDARKAFAQFQVANNQQDLERIIELVLRFVDLETSIPTIFQGEQQDIPETLGATNIMVDSNNVGLRGRVKRWDDQVTDPHLTRYYHWNMQYNKKPEIKGDFSVSPRGTSSLLKKDQDAKTIGEVMRMKGDPDFELLVDWEKAAKKFLSAIGLDILKSDDDYARAKKQREENPPPGDPRLETAKIKAETDLKKAEIDQQSDMAEIQTKGALTEQELTFKAEEAEKQRQHDMQMQNMELQIKMMEFASREGINLDQIKGKLSGEAMKLKTQISLAGPDKEGPQVTTPLVEPEGRAKDGRAYQD
ncbi:MAG: hypothetical protein JRC86_04545 [Deltaproteobacteria bacterium]|nr:hypothetical protein [Deltaproteobacteria bacterium]